MTTHLTKTESPRKEDAATQQISREAAEQIDQLQQDGELGVPSLTKIILSAIERSTAPLRKQLANVAKINTETNANLAEVIQSRSAQPQPSKGSPASGERSEPKIGDWVKTSLDSEYSYEVADLRQFPHGLMIGIYDEPPSKHIDYWNPSNLYATAHHSEPRSQQQEWTPEMIFRYFNAMEPPPFAHVERLTKDINAELAAAYTEAFIDVRSELESRIEALTQQLAAERRRREQAEQTMQEIAETYKVEMERYRRESGCPDELTLGIHILQLRAKEQRLLSALAAIDAALKAPWTDVGQILAPIDLSALHEHDAEVREKQRQEDWDELAKLENKLAKVREPMVEALFQCVDAMNTPELRHARCSQKYVNAHKAGRDALAKVKEQ